MDTLTSLIAGHGGGEPGFKDAAYLAGQQASFSVQHAGSGAGFAHEIEAGASVRLEPGA